MLLVLFQDSFFTIQGAPFKREIVLTDQDKYVVFSVQGADVKAEVLIDCGKQRSLDGTANKHILLNYVVLP